MSGFNEKSVPKRWILCPNHGELVPDTRFVPLKTPLGKNFTDSLFPDHRFTPQMFIEEENNLGRNVIAIFSFANSNARYELSELEELGVQQIWIKCGQSAPTDQHFNDFRNSLNKLQFNSDSDVVGIHCTHGYNRTGFIIVRYLVEEAGYDLIEALNIFKQSRPPGIYKPDYIQKLFEIYNNSNVSEYEIPGKPNELWSFPPPSSLPHYYQPNKIPEDSESNALVGVEIKDSYECLKIKRAVQVMCKTNPRNNFFPGSQPVTLSKDLIHVLEEDPTYRATYKSDGTRYFLLALEGKSYIIDRKFEVREVNSLLVDRKGNRLQRTLLDGELVTEKDDQGNPYHNFLIFDIVEFEEFNLMENDWDTRMDYVSLGIIAFRKMLMEKHLELFQNEDFLVTNKKQWRLNRLHKLQEYVEHKVRHDTDGIIFTPLSMPYIIGKCPQILKWKPVELNSSDFIALLHNDYLYLAVRINYDSKQYADIPISILDIDEQMKNGLDNAIIECVYDRNTRGWKPLRIRTDKTTPNAYSTFVSVFESIVDDFTVPSLQKRFGFDNTFDPTDPDL
ncbi:mRNA-capping enzyme [Histomonas meleagridis]|uniref:mRNA-capping enzyme n=1 Tax=Histomonas meleagridis TaxID=135588 RepID=UPI003559F960|nr:mRNA-capping enzyme [Histomonas meleagridis]KAH0806318.1 mRNA-capping enzyme [Histomonas meleagridis]